MARFKNTLLALHFLTLAGLFMPPLSAHATATDSTAAPLAQDAIYQLRIYEIFEDNKVAFHERFRDHAMRIMGSTSSPYGKTGPTSAPSLSI